MKGLLPPRFLGCIVCPRLTVDGVSIRDLASPAPWGGRFCLVRNMICINGDRHGNLETRTGRLFDRTKEGNFRRRSWREGPHPRGTADRRPWFGHCAELPRRSDWRLWARNEAG